MFINLEKPEQGPYYALYDWDENSGKNRIANYGKQKPHFNRPELYNGPCQNYLDESNTDTKTIPDKS